MRKLLNLLTILMVVVMLFCIGGCSNNKQDGGTESTTTTTSSVESQLTMSDIEKDLSDYTWEDFESLSGDEQMKFQNSFGTPEAFEEWMDNANSAANSLPWKNGGKQPEEYTWEEFEALTGPQQIEFQYSFESIDEFDVWLNRVKPE